MTALRRLAGTLVLVVLIWGLMALAVLIFGRRDYAREADVIVVLGAAQYDGRPSPVLQARLDHAIALHERGLADGLILTGGVGAGDTVSEATVGRRYARKAGVPDANIFTELVGLSSGQSMIGVAEIMHEQGMESAILVSDPFHMLRLRILAWRLGIDAHSSPTRASPIIMGSPDELRRIAREGLILPFALLPGL
jgi:uncharacterized SAM-binding protein YcdF (DUF218 family)